MKALSSTTLLKRPSGKDLFEEITVVFCSDRCIGKEAAQHGAGMSSAIRSDSLCNMELKIKLVLLLSSFSGLNMIFWDISQSLKVNLACVIRCTPIGNLTETVKTEELVYFFNRTKI